MEFFVLAFPGIYRRKSKIALVAESVDAQDLKSCLQQCEYGFNSRLGHKSTIKALKARKSRICRLLKALITLWVPGTGIELILIPHSQSGF